MSWLQMQNSTSDPTIDPEPSNYTNHNVTTEMIVITSKHPMSDSQVEAWQVVVPLFIVITAVIIIIVVLVVVLVVYKKHRQWKSAVFPVVERVLETDGQCERIEGEWTHSRKASMEATLVSISGSDDLEVTRTKSLTVLIPRGEHDRRMLITVGSG